MRLFVAVDVGDEVRDKMEDVLNVFKDFKGIKPVERENLHITLMFLGEVPDRRVEVVKEKLGGVKCEQFKISFKGIGFFPSQRFRVVWIGVDEGRERLKELSDSVSNSMRSLGFRRDKEFVAHVTVARVKRIDQSERERLMRAIEKYRDFEFGEMVVDCFKLKRSILTPKGPIYEDLHVYKL